jgi:thymidine kinase
MSNTKEEYETLLKNLVKGISDEYILVDGEKIKFNYEGKIIGIQGPMRGGKSDILINEVNKSIISDAKTLVLKPSIDTRQTNVSSRRKTNIQALSVDNILDRELIEKCINNSIDVIAIDEAHFIENIHVFCELMANLGKIIYVAFIDGSYNQNQFPNIGRLIPLLDESRYYDAICANCPYGKLRNARFTILCNIGNANNIENEIQVGDSQYMSVCRKCLNSHRLKNYVH